MKKYVETGRVVMTRGIQSLATDNPRVAIGVHAALARFRNGDWGDIPPEDIRENEIALESGERLLGSYRAGGTKIWVITEWDHSVTTVLLPEEY